jgi:hypothetical protein
MSFLSPGRCLADIVAGHGVVSDDPAQQRSQLGLDVCVGHSADVHPPLRDDHDVQREHQQTLVEPEELAQEPLEPVPPDGTTDLLADGEPQAPEKNALSRGQGEKNEVPALIPPALGVAFLELGPFRKAMAPGEL